MKRNKSIKLTTKNALTAHAFLIPFYLGVLFFFLLPLIHSFEMSIAKVRVTDTGYRYLFTGWSNYHYAFFKDAKFGTNMTASLGNMLWKVPTVNIFAIFLALLANQKFKGRGLIRAIFFLPLIFASGVAFECINSDYVAQNIMAGSDVSGGAISNTNVLAEMLTESGIGSQVISLVTKITDGIFSMAWASGVQMVLYLAALQSISPSLYEASQIEGASAWDNFWKITLPMLLPIMLICFVYTVVDDFTAASNAVMKQITTVSQQGVNSFGIASAFSWSYSVFMLVILGVILGLFRLSNRGDKQKGGKRH